MNSVIRENNVGLTKLTDEIYGMQMHFFVNVTCK